MNLTAAIAQVDSRVGDVAHNVAHHVEIAERAAARGAQLVIFPELSLTGYTLRDLSWEVALDPESADVLAPLRKTSRRISIVAGAVTNGPGHGIFNSGVLFEDGEVRHIHRKVYLPTYGMFEEGRYFSPGNEARAFDSKYGRFGILICEDVWHVSLPYLLALDGAEAIFCLTASPTRLAGDSVLLDNATVNHEHHRTFARLLNVYMLFCNRVGFEDGVNFWGGSIAASPDGELLASARTMSEDLITTVLNSDEVLRARRFSRHFLDERPEMVFRALERHLRR